MEFEYQQTPRVGYKRAGMCRDSSGLVGGIEISEVRLLWILFLPA